MLVVRTPGLYLPSATVCYEMARSFRQITVTLPLHSTGTCQRLNEGECVKLAQDYFECLHHRKEIARINTILKEAKRLDDIESGVM